MSLDKTPVVLRDGKWWIGRIEATPGVNAQERTVDELLSSRSAAPAEYLEMNRADDRCIPEP